MCVHAWLTVCSYLPHSNVFVPPKLIRNPQVVIRVNISTCINKLLSVIAVSN